MSEVICKKGKHGHDEYYLAEKPEKGSMFDQSEDGEAKNFYGTAIVRHPELKGLLFHVANEGMIKPQYGAKRKLMGVVSGVADYILLMPSGDYNFAIFEMKKVRGVPSDIKKEQVAFLDKCKAQGGYGCITFGYKAALFALNKFLKQSK